MRPAIVVSRLAITFWCGVSGTMAGSTSSLGRRRPLSLADLGPSVVCPPVPTWRVRHPQQSFIGRRTLAVAVKIKLKRMGKIRAPYYRIIVADARTKRDGRAIEEIGKYHPKVDPSLIEVDSDRAQYWLSVGAQPTDPVRRILEVTGDWQKFKGLPGAEGTLKTATPKPDKRETFAAAAAETIKDLKVKGKTAEPRAGGKAADGKTGDAKAGDAKAGDAKAGDAKADKGAEKGRSRRSGASGDKAQGKAADASGKASAGKPAKDGAAKDGGAKDSAAKDGAAKDGAAKDGAAKDGAAKDSGAKDGAAKDGGAKDSGAKDGAGKDSAAKGTTAKAGAKGGSAAKDAAAEGCWRG